MKYQLDLSRKDMYTPEEVLSMRIDEVCFSPNRLKLIQAAGYSFMDYCDAFMNLYNNSYAFWYGNRIREFFNQDWQTYQALERDNKSFWEDFANQSN